MVTHKFTSSNTQKGVKILVIEDSPDILENTTELLELEGFSTLKANNGATGINQAVQNEPDLIITDIIMPDFDGYYVLKELSSNVETQHIPIIFCTALSEPKQKMMGLSMGADDYVVKPFDFEDLLLSVNNCLNRRDLLKTEAKEVLLKRRYNIINTLTA